MVQGSQMRMNSMTRVAKQTNKHSPIFIHLIRYVCLGRARKKTQAIERKEKRKKDPQSHNSRRFHIRTWVSVPNEIVWPLVTSLPARSSSSRASNSHVRGWRSANREWRSVRRIYRVYNNLLTPRGVPRDKKEKWWGDDGVRVRPRYFLRHPENPVARLTSRSSWTFPYSLVL